MAKAVSTTYDDDVILWSQEQARGLRERDLDIEHLADEIEDVGKSEKRELANRIAVLLAHLFKWRFQPERRSPSRRRTIGHQRKRIALLIKGTPSLKTVLRDPDWRREMWLAALEKAGVETGLGEDAFPEISPWDLAATLDPEFWPDV
jgi:ribosomal protein L29